MTDADTQRLIVQTARRFFMEHGYRSVSTRRIAEACGLTQPALYHYFATKQDLYVAVMIDMLASMQSVLERIAKRSESTQGRLHRIALYLLEQSQEGMEMMMHDIQKELDSRARDTINQRFFQAMIAPIASVFAGGLASGEFVSPTPSMQPVSLTFILLNMVKYRPASREGSITQDISLVEERELLSSHARGLVQLLLQGLQAR